MTTGLNSRQVLIWSALALSVLATIWTSLAEDENQDIAVLAVSNNAAASAQSSASTQSSTSNTSAANTSASGPQRMQLAALTLAATNTSADKPLDTRQLQRPRWEDSAEDQGQLHDPFQGNSRQAGLEAAPLQAAQQVMEIPPLPFSYAGKLMDNGQYTVFLSAGEQNYSVKRGDVVLGWQVKSIAPPTMTLRYQAMQMDVPLMIGEQN